jgi:hypothetical protein
MSVRQQAVAMIATCNTVLAGPAAHTVPDVRITALAARILEAAKVEVPKDKILAAIEIEHGSWPVILSAMHAVVQALPSQ